MNERRNDIDNARAILIAMVVLGHILNCANPGYSIIPYVLVREFFNAFEMPAFFLLSGMMTDGEKWRRRSTGEYFVRKVKTLVVPYVFFECIAIIYKHFILHTISLTDGLCAMITLHCNVGADWFLPAMFLACAFYYIYIRFPYKMGWGISCVIFLLMLHFLTPVEGRYWQILLFRGILGFVFMMVGNLLKNQLANLNWKKIGCALFLTAASAAICFKLSLDNSFYSGVLCAPALSLISGTCGASFILGLARRIPWKWLAWIGQNTLVIMGTHQLVLYTIPGNSSPLWVAGVFVLIAAVETAVVYLTNRFCPELIGKKRKEPSYD